MQIKKTVSSVYSTSGKIVSEKDSQEFETIELDTENPVRVELVKSVTKNLGNYESLRVQGSISLPCYLDEESTKNAFAVANNILDETISTIVNEEMGE